MVPQAPAGQIQEPSSHRLDGKDNQRATAILLVSNRRVFGRLAAATIEQMPKAIEVYYDEVSNIYHVKPRCHLPRHNAVTQHRPTVNLSELRRGLRR